MHRFTVVKRKFGKTSKSLKNYENDSLQNHFVCFVSLLTAPIVKKVIFGLEFTLTF